MARTQFKFWLDNKKRDERNLIAPLQKLKKRRKFAPTVRDAMRLILDLREGRVDVLLELFPFVKDKLAPPPMPSDDELKKRLDLLERWVLMRGSDSDLVAAGQGAPVRTPRPQIYKPPVVDTPPPVVEVDISEAFLNAF